MYHEPVKVKISPVKLEVAAAQYGKQYRDQVCRRFNMAQECIRVDTAIKPVPNKTYCKITVYYSLAPDRFNDDFFQNNASKRIIFINYQEVLKAAARPNHKFFIP